MIAFQVQGEGIGAVRRGRRAGRQQRMMHFQIEGIILTDRFSGPFSSWPGARARAGHSIKVLLEVSKAAPPVRLVPKGHRQGLAFFFGVSPASTDYRVYDIPIGKPLDLAVQDVRHLRRTEMRCAARLVCVRPVAR